MTPILTPSCTSLLSLFISFQDDAYSDAIMHFCIISLVSLFLDLYLALGCCASTQINNTELLLLSLFVFIVASLQGIFDMAARCWSRSWLRHCATSRMVAV
jgi:hypothetical protein